MPTTTIIGRAPASTLPVTFGQIRVLLVTHQAVDEVYGGTRMTWDGKANALTFNGLPEEDGTSYKVVVTVKPAGATRATVDVTATLTVPRAVTSEERAKLRVDANRQALQESRDMVAILMKQVAKGVGRGFADPPPPKGLGLTG